jgi:hypothetical protein
MIIIIERIESHELILNRLVNNTNFLFGRYTFDPPAPLVKGGARKVSVASIEEFGISRYFLRTQVGKNQTLQSF